jgi:PAS domain S-box-containing protein
MRSSESKTPTRHVLRARAEAALRGVPTNIGEMSAANLRRLVRELEVHQIELGMQNEELREAQVELANSRDRWVDLYDFAPVGYVTLDAQANVLEINQTGLTKLGIQRREALGRRFTHWLAPEAQDTFYLHHRAVFSSNRRHICELLLRKADGLPFPARVESICVTDPATQARSSRSLISDISESKTNEQSLRESEERFRALASGTFEGVAIIDGGRLVEVNEQLARILGYPSDELRGMDVAPLIAPEHRQRVLATIRNGRKSRAEHALLRRNGERCLVESRGLSINYQGRPVRIAAIRDITEYKRLEAEFRRANIHLEHRVSERTTELNLSHQELLREVTAHHQLQQQVLAASEADQRRLGAEMHDGLCAQLAALRFANETLHKQLRHISPSVATQVAEMGRLLADTLAQARNLALMLNPVELEAEGFMMALAKLAGETQRLYRTAVRLVCPRPVLVSDHAAANHLFRIAQEAIRNAVTHGKPSRITIGLHQTEGTLKLTVANNGRPFPKALRGRLGMGLSNLRYRAESIGARLHIGPGPRGGALLTCAWPVRDGASLKPTPRAQPLTPAGMAAAASPGSTSNGGWGRRVSTARHGRKHVEEFT